MALVQGGHLNGGTQTGLGDGDRDGDVHVLSLAGEERVLLDLHGHQEVAAAARARVALARNLQPLAVLHALRDAHRGGLAVAPAQLDRGAAVGRAQRDGGGRVDVLALAGRGLVPAVAALAAESAAGAEPRVSALRAAELREEVLEAASAARGGVTTSPAATAVEQVPEDVLETCTPGAARGPTGREACTRAHGADGVVLLTLLGVGQHRVGLSDVLELLLRGRVPRVLVRVVRAGQLAVRLLDVLG